MLKRLYMTLKIATKITWHKRKTYNDALMRHLYEFEAKKSFNRKYSSFPVESRNI